MFAIVLRPEGALITAGMALAVIAHVAMSPLIPSLMVMSISGVPSIIIRSCGLGSPTVALKTRVITSLSST